MKNYHNLIIEPLNSTHDRVSFSCGVKALDQYLQKQAGQDIKRRISRVFVASLPVDPKTVVGYYSLSTLSIELSQMLRELNIKLPKHPIPAALIGRLAVGKDAQKCGIGKILLANAIKRTLSISQQIGIYAMVVDAIDGNAETFYEQFGFARLSENSTRFFLPLRHLKI